MTQNQQIIFMAILAGILIWLFSYSAKQKRAHEDKMTKLRAERKAAVEKSKQQAAQDS